MPPPTTPSLRRRVISRASSDRNALRPSRAILKRRSSAPDVRPTTLTSDRNLQSLRLSSRPASALPTPAGSATRKRTPRGQAARPTYSRKVFIPLTKLCRDVCHYCTFAQPPRRHERAYLSLDEVLAIARAGGGGLQGGAVHARRPAGAALPRRRATSLGASDTDDLLLSGRGRARGARARPGCCRISIPAVLTPADVAALREVSVSQGLMLEIRIRAAVRARRPAPRLARQASARRGSRPSVRPASSACRSPPAF